MPQPASPVPVEDAARLIRRIGLGLGGRVAGIEGGRGGLRRGRGSRLFALSTPAAAVDRAPRERLFAVWELLYVAGGATPPRQEAGFGANRDAADAVDYLVR